MLGAGRRKAEDLLDYGAGIIIHKKLGDEVRKGDILAEILANDSIKLAETSKFIRDCFIITKNPVEIPKLILDEWII
jgi:thymidine phosphorylase